MTYWGWGWGFFFFGKRGGVGVGGRTERALFF